MKERFEIIETIGSGGMGVVYKAFDRVLSNQVAIKVLGAGASDDFMIRFQNEARAFAMMNHPNLLMVRDFGVSEEGAPYLVMDFIEGKSLAQIVKQDGPLSFERALPIFLQICAGLAYAHGKGLLHRDIKPGNVMISGDESTGENVKILDFGLVKFQKQDQSLTTTGGGLGTPLYMSPEQARGDKEIDARSDIYSFGCLMFESLTGVPPIQEETALETLSKKSTVRAPLLEEASAERVFSQELEKIVARCLEIDPVDRFTSVDELRKDLERLTVNDESSESPEQSAPVSSSRRKPAVLIAAIVALLAFGSVIAFSFLPKESPAPEPEAKPKEKMGTIDDPLILFKLEDDFKRMSLEGDTAKFTGNFEDKDLAAEAAKFTPRIKSVSFKQTDVKGSGLSAFAGKNLICIYGSETRFGPEAMPEIGKLKTLEVLYLAELTDEGVVHLKKLPRLKQLTVFHGRLSAKGCEILGSIPLRTLTIRELHNASADQLKHLRNIPAICLGGPELSAEALSGLVGSTKLDRLDLFHVKRNLIPDSVPVLNSLPALRKIHVEDVYVDDKTIDALASVKQLVDFQIGSQTVMPKKNLEKLSKFPMLEVLNFDVPLQASVDDYLVLARCPKLRVIQLTVNADQVGNQLRNSINKHREPGHEIMILVGD